MDSIYLLPGEERCVNFRDAEVQLVIRFVVDFVIAKRYVADR